MEVVAGEWLERKGTNCHGKLKTERKCIKRRCILLAASTLSLLSLPIHYSCLCSWVSVSQG